MDAFIIAGKYTDWYIGLGLAFAAVTVAVIIVAVILTLAARIADQAATAVGGVDAVRSQTTSLNHGVDEIIDSAVRILHSARAVRKVVVGK